MKLEQVVNQIRAVLPKHTGLASNNLNIDSIASTDTLATINTIGSHNFNGNESITIANANFHNGLTAVSKDGLVFTFTTLEDHDLSEGWQESVTFEGFTDTDWNASFPLIKVPNRRTFKVQSVNTLPVLNGNEILLEPRNDGVNGRYPATVVTSNQFTVPGSFLTGDYSGGSVSGEVRVASSATIERALEEYDKQASDDIWIYVIASDATVSKDRSTFSDNTASMPNGTDIRTRLIDGFRVFLVKSTKNEIAGATSLDVLRHDMLLPLMQTLYGTVFDSGLSASTDFRTVLTGHGLSGFDGAKIVYVYEFEVTMDLTNDDQVENSDNRAFRDIDYTQQQGSQELTVGIDLDDEPL